MHRGSLLLACLLALGLPGPGFAQAPPPDFRDHFLGQFQSSARKLVSLAQAMPAESMDWRPVEGVASVAQAYMHIARYNYYYPADALGVPAPEGLPYDRWEEEVSDKEQVVAILEESMGHVVRLVEGMTPEAMAAPTRLYGRDVPQWAVLFQLVSHMNEHLGQSIAYARSNGVAPPWSR